MVQNTIWAFAILFVLGAVLFIVIIQDRFIYFPLHYSSAELERARNLAVRKLSFRTSQGNQTAFFWGQRDSEPAPRSLWIVFGGNGSLALGWLDFFVDFGAPEAGFLLVDYPGYGICEGQPNPQSILENSEQAFEVLKERMHWNLGRERLGVLGYSLGSAAALQFAARHAVGKVVLISPFTSMDAMVRRQISISLGPLLRHPFDNVASLKAVLLQKPVPDIIIFHGQSDSLIPMQMGRMLAQLASDRIKFVPVAGADHNNIIQLALPRGLRAALVETGH